MKLRRTLLLISLAAPLACAGKKDKKSALAQDASPAAASVAIGGLESEPPPLQRVHFRASLEDLDDLIGFAEKVVNETEPAEPVDFEGQLQADLLQSGFGPGFYESLDLSGLFVVDVGYPLPQAGQPPPIPSDWEIAGVVPTHDARRLLDSMPDTLKPQPLGNGMWDLIDQSITMKLREKSGFVEFAGTLPDLDRAGRLPTEVGTGKRIRARVWDIPAQWLDPEAFLGPAPVGSGFAQLVGVVKAAKAVEVQAEWGSDRDFVAVAAAEAPFADLGLGPIGKPLTGSSALASKLPPGSAFALELAWGNPKLLHRILDQNVDPSQAPAPFDTAMADSLRAVHVMLDQLKDEVLMAGYVDKKGKASLVLAGQIKDEDTTRDAVRTLLASAEKALGAHISLQGSDPEKKYTVALKPGMSMGRTKADRFTVTVPKFMREDVKGLASLLGKGKPKLEAYAIVAGGSAFLVLGANAKKTAGDIARYVGKARAKSLETDGGLALARKTDAGCQLCVAADVIEGTRIYFVFARDGGENDKAAGALKKLDKIRLEGQAALALKVANDRGSLGLAFPRGLIADNPKGTRQLNELIDEVSQANAAPDPWDLLGSAPESLTP
jgi:hypothetical protein